MNGIILHWHETNFSESQQCTQENQSIISWYLINHFIFLSYSYYGYPGQVATPFYKWEAGPEMLTDPPKGKLQNVGIEMTKHYMSWLLVQWVLYNRLLKTESASLHSAYWHGRFFVYNPTYDLFSSHPHVHLSPCSMCLLTAASFSSLLKLETLNQPWLLHTHL